MLTPLEGFASVITPYRLRSNSIVVGAPNLELKIAFVGGFCYNIAIMTAEERQKQVDDAIANEKLEGLEVSSYTRKVMDDYVAGKVTAKQAAEQVYSRYGV